MTDPRIGWTTRGCPPAGILVAIILLLLPVTAFAIQAVIDGDTWVEPNNHNHGGDQNLQISPNQRALFRFDFSGLPGCGVNTCSPPSPSIQKATRVIFPSSVGPAGSFNIMLAPAFDESSHAIANIYSGVTSVPVAACPVAIPPQPIGTDDANTFVTVDVTCLVQAWVSGAIPNNGLAIVGSGNTKFTLDGKGNGGQTPFINIALGGLVGATGAIGPTGPTGLAVATLIQVQQRPGQRHVRQHDADASSTRQPSVTLGQGRANLITPTPVMQPRYQDGIGRA